MKKSSLNKVTGLCAGIFMAAVVCAPVMGTAEACSIPSSTFNVPTTHWTTNVTTTQNAYGIGLAFNSGNGGVNGENSLTSIGAGFNVYASNFKVAGLALAVNSGDNHNTIGAYGGIIAGGDSNTAVGVGIAKNWGDNNNVVSATGSVVTGYGNTGYGIGIAKNGGQNSQISSTGSEIDGGYNNTAIGISYAKNIGNASSINSYGVLGYIPTSTSSAD